MKEYDKILKFALQLARAAEAEILPRFLNCSVSLKADGSEVTDADRAAEQAIRKMIESHYPTHAILGEEFGGHDSRDAEQLWIIDPIDGTAWFTLGVPLFGTLIAYVENQQAVAGVIHLPAINETVYASRGGGCWFKKGGEQAVAVRVSEPVPLSAAVVSATGVHSTNILHQTEQIPYNLQALIPRVRKFRFVSDCLQYALLCRGRLHAAVDTVMHPWDVAALLPCVAEAGGVASTLDGKRDDVIYGGSLVTACHPSVLEEVMNVLAPQGSE
ncbi:MAG TPA: inositol monophosphatase family protein, partial [bacterium]